MAKEQERERQRLYVEGRQALAEQKTAELGSRVEELDVVLTSVLTAKPLTFDRLTVVAPRVPFAPGQLGVAEAAPDWTGYAPIPPGGFAKIFGGQARYERNVAVARQEFESAVALHKEREQQRLRALGVAKAAHDREVAAVQERVASENTRVEAMRRGFAEGRPEAVEWFVGKVLGGSRYPVGFPQEYQVGYRPENRDILLEFELPPQSVVPEVRGYKYVKARDAVDPVPRSATEVRQR
ncbi:hypothetical protein J5X84_20015 [Streptosporangiaceae bacterium NEAU-GS5]|nr:hypothetical protein [Streptosporangiaceae bacterium NEAU-GS5]